MIANRIREWLLTCPFLKEESLVIVDKIGADPVQYAIAAMPCDPVYESFTDGAALMQFQFAIASREAYNERKNMDNTAFFDMLHRWIVTESRKRNLPILDDGRDSQFVEVITAPYVYSAEDSTAIYQIECRLVYHQSALY